ncbi:unnamed protein product [Lupinus luteus]|uniref:Uncharacterized protein n=1 Tax=Lupinus luteus TaxID=3873 RepID=A0AAV1XTS5_LUPLU
MNLPLANQRSMVKFRSTVGLCLFLCVCVSGCIWSYPEVLPLVEDIYNLVTLRLVINVHVKKILPLIISSLPNE